MGEPRAGWRRLAVAVGVVLLTLAHPWTAGADPVDETGYWWRLQPVTDSPAAPPGVEAGQLHVAADAAGIAAIAAVRAKVGTAPVEALVLNEVSSSGTPTLRACPTASWTKTQGAGALREAPSTDSCPVEGVPGTKTGSSWVFIVSDLVDDDGVLDVAIVPGLETQAVTFAAPDDDAVRRAPTAPVPEPAGGDLPVHPTAPSSPSSGVTVPGNSFALGQLERIPSSGLAAGVESVPAAAFDDDVVGLPRPTGNRSSQPIGQRSPLALAAAAIVIGAWTWRTNTALGAASAHPLFGSLRFGAISLAGAGEVLATAGQEPSDRPIDPATRGQGTA